MKGILLHGTTLAKVEKELNAFLETDPEIIKMSQCHGYDPEHKEIDFVLTIIYEPKKPKNKPSTVKK